MSSSPAAAGQKADWAGIAMLTLPPLFWAGNFIVGRAMRDTVPPLALSFDRWVIAFCCLSPFAWRAMLRDLPRYREFFWRLLGLAATGVAAFNVLVYFGLQSTSAANGMMLNSFIPLLIAGIGALFYRQRLTPAQIAGFIVSFFGVTLIVSHGDPRTLASQGLSQGDALVFIATVCWAFYTLWLRQRIDLESALREALSRRQLFLCYQPQICADTSRTLAFEALIRWQHPEYGLVPPAHFIPLAEAIGLINPIGAWVVETACAQLAAWHRAGHRPLRMAVNLSARQLLDPTLENTILRALAETGLTPPDLELEITESVLIQDPKRTVERLLALRKLGLRLSIDDFGTGYSSLSYLRILPVHALKLDRSFVDEMDKDTISREICASTIRLAQRLQLEIVAEGVETETQAQQLRELGCPIFQGYLFSHPLGAEAAEQHLQHKRSSENPCLLPLNSGPATAVP